MPASVAGPRARRASIVLVLAVAPTAGRSTIVATAVSPITGSSGPCAFRSAIAFGAEQGCPPPGFCVAAAERPR